MNDGRMAYDGRGNAVVAGPQDCQSAVTSLGGYEVGLYAEEWVNFDMVRPRPLQLSLWLALLCSIASPLHCIRVHGLIADHDFSCWQGVTIEQMKRWTTPQVADKTPFSASFAPRLAPPYIYWPQGHPEIHHLGPCAFLPELFSLLWQPGQALPELNLFSAHMQQAYIGRQHE